MDERIQALIERGVKVIDPRQTYVAPDVSLSRVCAGVVLYPGSRLVGARTFVGPDVQIGVEGPATLINAVLGAGARVDAGYVEEAVLLDEARAGWGAHLRPGTLLEEKASTAHCVGLKHTILLSFVTLGSLINFCDVLMAGGTSRKDHSEVGSGFIHFNFTPWGARGDKATPSLVGDVVRGVFLRERRIFLGGAGGLVGPGRVGYGSLTGAGQVTRRQVGAGRLALEATREVDREFAPGHLDRLQPRAQRNVDYIRQLVALRAWYHHVRLPRVPETDAHAHRRVVFEAALATLDTCIKERIKRLDAFARERGAELPALRTDAEVPPCPLTIVAEEPYVDHVTWVQSLTDDAVRAGVDWLSQIAATVSETPA